MLRWTIKLDEVPEKQWSFWKKKWSLGEKVAIWEKIAISEKKMACILLCACMRSCVHARVCIKVKIIGLAGLHSRPVCVYIVDHILVWTRKLEHRRQVRLGNRCGQKRKQGLRYKDVN